MKQIDLSQFKNVEFGRNVRIIGDQVNISDGVYIGDDVTIEAKRIDIGFDSRIERGVTVKGLSDLMSVFCIGDNCFVGFQNQILVPSFTMLDYSQLHNSGLHSGYSPLKIGYNCWIGQNCILNATANLNIGNNVRIGTQSQLWTHVASGELLEGCTLYGNNPLTLRDNVWIVGGAVISPGLILEENSIIMTGSVLTKSTIPRHTYAGVPAKDVTDKLNFWKVVDINDKKQMLKSFIDEFQNSNPDYTDRIFCASNIKDFDKNTECLIFSDSDFSPSDVTGSSNTYFNLINKKYTKRRTKIEIDWIKFAIGFRARFIPYE
jgi:acetyltransferase-like isoleucine patch superfamily enzyme